MSIQTKRKIKGLLGRAADMAGLLERNFRSKMLIVAFHRVNDWMAEDGITCSSEKFKRFCIYFQKHFKVVSLTDQIAGNRNGQGMGGTLSITFDDGYRDNVEVAAPILRHLGLPATFFVTTGFIGSDYAPPWDQHLSRQPEWMDWNHVRALRNQGFDIGAHSDRHIDLGSVERDLVRADLKKCRTKFLDELGSVPTLFAYPFGGRHNISPASLELVREAGFQCCLSACGGVNAPVADPFSLNRISIGGWFLNPDQMGCEILLHRV